MVESSFKFKLSTKYKLVYGTTTINHKLRLKLGLSLTEYVIASAIQQLRNKDKNFSYVDLFNYTGIEKEECKVAIDRLVKKKLVIYERGKKIPPEVSDEWINSFQSNAVEFEKFWRPETINGKKIKWGGSSKSDALSKYATARKEHSAEYLYARKIKYFEYLSICSYARNAMNASRWLNNKNREYETDWEDMFKDEVKNLSPAERKNFVDPGYKVAITESEINQLYEE